MSCFTCLAVGLWHSVFTQSLPAVAGCRSSAVWVLRWNVSVQSLVTWHKSGTALWPWHPWGWRTHFGWISLWGSCCPAQQGDVYNYLSSGPKDLLSDRCVLSCPSMDLVTCLLDFRLNLASHRSIIPRLAASLAACAQLSALGEWHLCCQVCLTPWEEWSSSDFSVFSFQLPVTECGPFKDWGSFLQLNLDNQLT